jgi:hypothetical protein
MEIVGRRFWSCRLPYPWRASRQGPPSTSDQSFGTDETTLDINPCCHARATEPTPLTTADDDRRDDAS